MKGIFKEAFQRHSIEYMISVSFTLIAIVGMLLVGGLSYFRFESTTEAVILEEKKQVINQVNSALDNYLKNMMRVSDTVYYTVVKNTDLNETAIDKSMDLLYAANKDSIVSISLFSNYGEVLVTTPFSKIKNNVDVRKQDWFKNSRNISEYLYFSTPHVQNIFQDPDYKYRWVVSLCRRVELTTGGDISQGILLVDINFSGIERICQNVNLGKLGYVYLVDSKGEIIHHPRQELLYSNLIKENNMNAIHYDDGNHIETFEGTKRLITVKSVEYTGWKIVAVTPLSNINATSSEINLFGAIVMLFAILTLIFVNFFLSKKIAHPIKKLENSVKALDEGFYDVNISIAGSYEIQHLGKTINKMVKQMRKLMDDIVIEHESKRKSELDALQSQINPHFLYNTLDSIVWMIESKRYEGAIEMVTSLAKLFRVSLSKGKNIVTLRDELQHAENYLAIQKVRFKNKFDYTIIAPKDYMEYGVIKIIIQPLIENALYHGIDYMCEDGEIIIKVHEVDKQMCIDVIDNGRGMTLEETQSLLTDSSRVRGKGSGIGLKNVNERIQLYFGDSSGISIHSEPDEGTTIRIHIPMVLYDEIEEKDR